MRKEMKGEAKCAWREELEAREGRRQRGGERRAAEQARRRDVRSGREERVGNARVNNRLHNLFFRLSYLKIRNLIKSLC